MERNQEKNRIALVTGATGYIGSRIVRELIQSGWQVNVIVRANSSRQLLAPYLESINFYIHDGSMDGMLEIINSTSPSTVFHLAAVTIFEHHSENIDELFETNIRFSTQIVEAMSVCGIKNFINTETFWQHFSGDTYNPVCLYAATKQAFRDILIYYTEIGKINAISLILYDNYGPDDPRRKLFSILKDVSQTSKKIDMTLGEQIVDITHVEDVAKAYLRASEILLEEKSQGLVTFSVTSGQRMTLRRIVDLVIRETGISLEVNWGGKPYRKREIMQPWVSNPLPGWQPRINLINGVTEFFK